MLAKIWQRIWKRSVKDDSEESEGSHPLDVYDPDKLDKIMRDERHELIKSSKDSQDNFVKTIITTSSALIVLMAGFVSQTNVTISKELIKLFGVAMLCLILSMIAALFEQFFLLRRWTGSASQWKIGIPKKYEISQNQQKIRLYALANGYHWCCFSLH